MMGFRLSRWWFELLSFEAGLRRSMIVRTLVVLAVTALSLLFGTIFEPIFGEKLAISLFLPGVTVCAWIGGITLGLVQTLCSMLVMTVFFEGLPHWGVVVALGLEGALISYLAARARSFSDQRSAQESTRDLQERMRLAFEATAIGFWEWNIETGKVRWDAQMFEIYGMTPTRDGVIPYAVWRQFVLPEDLEAQELVLGDTIRRKGSSRREFRIRRTGEKECRYIEAVETIRKNAAGEAEWVVGTNLDITERKKADDALREAEAKHQLVTDALPVLISYIDSGLRYRMVNRMYRKWFGIETVEVPGVPVEQVLGTAAFEAVRPLMERALAGESVSFEKLIPYKGVGSRFVHAVYIPDFDAGRKVRGFVVLVEDITDRKRAEEERLVLERERLARAEAEHANKMKDDFIATLSHELRAPLNSILGWIQLAKMKQQIPADLTEAFRAIERSARVQNQLISDILDVNRISSGKLRLDVKTGLDAEEVVDAAIEVMLPSSRAKQIRIDKVVNGPLPPITGDARRLQQCVWNLLSNAIKFSPEKGRVSVELSGKGKGLEITVHDDGRGIKEDFIPHLFERFVQADSSSTRAHGGLGLGLAIVKHIVELHGGCVRAQSAGEGLGSTFTIELPCGEVSSGKPALLSPNEGALSHVSLKGLKILAVDDEMEAKELLRGFLQDAGAEVWSAASADEALRLLERADPDLILSDVSMPLHDGYYLIEEVRRRGKQIPAIALTAHAQDIDRKKALESGFQEHLAKPIELSELLTRISSLASPTPDIAA